MRPAPLSRRRYGRTLVVLVVVAVAALGASLFVGPMGIGPPEPGLWSLRALRVGLAFVVGAALALGGAALQPLLRNPLADPFVLGVSGGAALGAAAFSAVLALPVLALPALPAVASGLGLQASAVAGAVLATLLLTAFIAGAGRARGGGRGAHVHGDTALLVGIVLNAFSWAFVAVVRAILPAQSTGNLSVWLIGSIGHPTPVELGIALAVALPAVVVVLRQAGALWLARHGDDEARRLGVDTGALRAWTLGAVSVLVGVAVATSGVIGFIGLIAPHATRRLVGDDDRLVLPGSALVGGVVLVSCDALGRLALLAVGSELPAGALSALFGAPAFALLLWRSMHAGGRHG